MDAASAIASNDVVRPCALAIADASIGAGKPIDRPSTSADANLVRAMIDLPVNHSRPSGQPPTLGGLKRSWPS